MVSSALKIFLVPDIYVRKILLSLRVQGTVLMMKHYKKCPSREKSIILQNDQNSEKPQDGKYTTVQ